jgi:glycosyltransferase involved in cell wall biosynthesis
MRSPLSEAPVDTTVVIPVYYNEKTIESVVDNLLAAWTASGRSPECLEYVLVDDGSQDGSWRALQRLRARCGDRVTILRLAKNHGSQLAILAGASLARGQRIAMVTADGQEPADLVARMAAAADAGSRLVLGVRRSRADSTATRAGAGFFYRLIRFLGLRSMPAQGFDAFLMDQALMGTILDMRDPNIPLAVTIAWLGYPYAEVDYDRLERREGRSRWTLAKKTKLALDAITAVSYMPIRAISFFGVALALLGFLYAIFVVAGRLMGGIPVEGWTSLFVAVLVIGGTQLLSLGVIGEYLWRTLEVTRHRPLWSIAEQEGPAPAARQTQDQTAGER